MLTDEVMVAKVSMHGSQGFLTATLTRHYDRSHSAAAVWQIDPQPGATQPLIFAITLLNGLEWDGMGIMST